MNFNWKQDMYKKFSPILGMERTEELISSIEEVYSRPEKYEDALNIINYLVEISEENTKTNNELFLTMKKLNYYLLEADNINIFYKMTTFIAIVFLFIIKDSLNLPHLGFLVGLFFIPIIYEIYTMTKKNGDKEND